MENPSSGSNSSFDDDGGGGGSGGGFDSVESDGKSLFTQEITNLQTMLLQNTTTRLLAYSHTKRFYRSEEEEILERARVKQSFVALETTEKWILRVQLYIPPMHRHNDFVKIRAIYIEEITRLIEKEIKEADFIHYHTQCV
jgi:hypothetical protein